MQATVRIRRYNPEKDKKPYWAEYSLEVDARDRILDILHKIKWEIDGSLAFRRSCAHGICGSDAMLINGRNRLACKVLMMDIASTTVTVEPIRGLPVEKDLIVDMKPFFDSYEAVLPFFINNDPAPVRERLQSPEEREVFDASTKCILCACCTGERAVPGACGDCAGTPIHLRLKG
jgi:succinate dehydrogenase / fumarate reductase iron-sulfur subunit